MSSPKRLNLHLGGSVEPFLVCRVCGGPPRDSLSQETRWIDGEGGRRVRQVRLVHRVWCSNGACANEAERHTEWRRAL